ncbi:MAG: LysR family transcriptional regulator [Hyphomicrobiales bacterium]|nr:LysR family transcriptional regulator [Hyphomicrobiales bacterium]
MLTPRRYLPSISLLASFDAAARSQSFTLAAQELNLTQSAVSRHIKALEEQVGVSLFMRRRQKVSLTPAGENYARDIHEALRMIASASMTLQINPGGGILDLAILPTFGTIWLAPRLSGFLSENPGVTVNFTTRLKPFDFNTEQVDAAVHFGRPHWPNTQAVFLMNETVLPVCSVDFYNRHQFTSSAQLSSAPLIHLSSRPDGWAHWFQTQEIQYQSNTGMVFDQFATAAQAAKHGLGIALLPEFLIERELQGRDLIPASNIRIQSEEAYYLVWPEHSTNFPPLAAFRDWIVAEVNGSG